MKTLSRVPTQTLLEELRRRGTFTEPVEISESILNAVAAVSEAFGVRGDLIFGQSKLAHIAKARFAAWLLLREQGLANLQIAPAFGRKDVGTVRHGCIRGRQLIVKEKAFAKSIHRAAGIIEGKSSK